MNFRSFSERHPALCFGLSALFGSLLYFEGTWWLAAAWVVFFFFLSWKRALLQAAATLLFALYSFYLFSDDPTAGEGKAAFAIRSVQKLRSPFASGWVYQGTLLAFESEEGRWETRLPCRVFYRGDEALRPRGDCDYLLEGRLCRRDRFSFTFKAKQWKPLENTCSFAELRMKGKTKIRSLLRRQIETRSADFLTALFAGEIDDRVLRFEFGRLGLQHILAISGFHFALVASFAAFFLRFLCPYRPRLFALLATALLYFIFVGHSAPVFRSFLAAALFLSGRLLERRPSALNLLGGCLLFELALNPLSVLEIGFQLSFLSCGAILLLNAPVKRLLSFLFPTRSLQEAAALSPTSQLVYICTSFFSRALSLTLAVNLALSPLLLHHFHCFPLLSLLYNLFIPPLSALCLLLLLPALALYPLSPLLAAPFFKTAGFVAAEMLEVIANPPALLEAALFAPFPGWALALWLGLLFLTAIYLPFSPLSGRMGVHFRGDRSSVG